MTDVARRVRMHASTCRMLGVEFIPARGRQPDALSSVQTAMQSAGSFSRDVAAEIDAKVMVNTRSSVSAIAAEHVVRAVRQPGTVESRPAAETFVPSGALFAGTDAADGAPAELEFQPLPKLPSEQTAALLDRLRQRYERDAPHAKFVTDHHTIVFGDGDPGARLMFVGEAPGAEEDKVGRPFVGRAGQLLDKMITAMGLERKAVYITNVLKTRPPNNATPTFDEAAACAPYLFEQIAIVRPEAIVTLGLPATRLLLHTAEAMSRLRGRWARFTIPRALPHLDAYPAVESASVPVMPTFHPAFLLRSYTPENRQKVWSDLLMVLDRLGLPRPKAPATK